MSDPSPPGPPVPHCYRHPGREAYIRCQRCDRTICPDCMVPASVGFQCPSCVHEGAKQTRQNKTAYGGTRSANPALTSWVLIGLNVAVWLLITVTGGAKSDWVLRLSLMGRGLCSGDGGMWTQGNGEAIGSSQACDLIAASGREAAWLPGVADGAWWQLVTSMFAHVEPMHIGFNMLALWFLGPQLEMVLGRLRFLGVYLGSGLVGSGVVYLLTDPSTHTLGASGAVFGLIGALIVIGWKVGGDIRTLLAWLGINLVITFMNPGISWQGHLGGFIGGVLLAGAFAFSPRERRGTWQLASFIVLMVAVAALIAARTAMLV
ncbi:membrane associated rhomboid family serine protease [Nocardioides daedukensis]|uniref:Membrane associated rhomboid family serine protease n=1 Tax=Nocardioides daedukensis TaxID=634462 RepID=A0A7Y9S1F3_9ACTN|nr:rhomboid family intramembrane serine protease [Nocardioides daedukensis]NYG59431.1 membrane associated rhomboid family serine protease [Nocardioides daedukensis]